MPCVHLHQLIKLCEDHQLKLGGSDVIQLVCEQCGQQEVCPDMLMDEYDARREQSNTLRADIEASDAKG